MRSLLLAALAVLALAACGSEEASMPDASAPEASAPTAEESPVSGTGLDGEPVSLADFGGKPVFVNVWSSW